MAQPQLSGVHIPVVTPFRGGQPDRELLARLIEHFIAEGAAGIAPCGTTGESATLSHDEHRQVVEWTVEACAGRVPVIAGTGSNSTAEAVDLTRHAKSVGADAALVICPYYNWPTQEGLVAHFTAVAEGADIPIVMYNIPSRTGTNMEALTTIELSKVPNIVGIKEASGDLQQIGEIIAGADGFDVLSGDDHMLLPVSCLGGVGGIVASAHIATREWVAIPALVARNQIAQARQAHHRLMPLVRALFFETNPIPVKAALGMLGFEVGDPRLPLLPASQACREALRAELAALGLLAT